MLWTKNRIRIRRAIARGRVAEDLATMIEGDGDIVGEGLRAIAIVVVVEGEVITTVERKISMVATCKIGTWASKGRSIVWLRIMARLRGRYRLANAKKKKYEKKEGAIRERKGFTYNFECSCSVRTFSK
jgi:hypothetical protein